MTQKDFAKVQPESRATRPSSPLPWLTLLSLDAPAVAVMWQILFARSFHVHLKTSTILLLGLVVWLIYVADRFLDTLPPPGQGTEALRHRFYRRRRWAFLVPFCAIFLLACWIAATQLEPQTFRNGLIIMLVVGLYFLLVHLRGAQKNTAVPKEMLVGILFGVGTCFPVWERVLAQRIRLLVPSLVFTALCWLNCAAIEYSEWVRLRKRQFNSPHPWTQWMGRRMILVAFCTALLAGGFVVAGRGLPDWKLALAEVLSAGTFVLLGLKEDSISPDRFRIFMDLALLTPVLFLPFAR